ncbi:hypothetical protein [Streptomyces seoulensis]|uniref:hypothetical protein n=1 Tax=Streptomyces seoulensis TaxID=73044 RepID=UPI00339F0301
MRVVPALGHLAVRTITSGVVDRSVQNWIADEHSRSTVKHTIAVRVMEQAVRDGVIKVNPARVSGWQKLYKQAEDELRDPRALALPGGGSWTVRRQTTPAPGGLTDKGTKDKRARKVPIIEEIRPLVAQRILSAGRAPDARLFTGPRGGRVSTV